jgi:flagellar biosynthesis/type III secretory pathway protein FliH
LLYTGPRRWWAAAAFTRGLGGAAESADLRRDFAAWARRLAGVAARDRWHDEQEDVMLDQKIRELFEDRRLEGVAEGRAEGRKEGRKEGEAEGRKLGEVEGRKQGEVAGRKKGEVEVLVRLLERKFGPLDEVSRARLAAADSERLLSWAERVLTASRLAEVFAD